MSILAAIPVVKEVVRWMRNGELIEHLKKEIDHLKLTQSQLDERYESKIESKEKEIDKLRRRVKKLEKL